MQKTFLGHTNMFSTYHNEMNKKSSTNKILTLLSTCITTEQVAKLNQAVFDEFKELADRDLVYLSDEAKDIESTCKGLIEEVRAENIKMADFLNINQFIYYIRTQESQPTKHILEKKDAEDLFQYYYDRCYQLFFDLVYRIELYSLRDFREIKDYRDLNKLIILEAELEKSKLRITSTRNCYSNFDTGNFNPFRNELNYIKSFPPNIEILSNPNEAFRKLYKNQYYLIWDYNYVTFIRKIEKERNSNQLCLTCGKKLSFLEKRVTKHCSKHR